MWDLLIIFGVLMFINGIFLYKQTLETYNLYNKYRKMGDLIIGNIKKFIFITNAITVLVVDSKGCILESFMINGILPFQRIKIISLPYINYNINFINKIEDKSVDYLIKKTIIYSINKYKMNKI